MPRDDVDERGDAVFRFRLEPPDHRGPQLTHEDFFREHLRDLLQIVRFSFQGKPVIVDAFAFRESPQELIPIMPEGESEEPRTGRDQAAETACSTATGN